ncbi:MAG: HAD-IA family hydrolase [Chloroflexi bacterium]|nr:HAD-IA family hydrolase [Chloroflexota bacterium]
MKYEAVIFDLFGTLIENLSVREQERVCTEMASVLSVPSDDFMRLWSNTFSERVTGTIPSCEANIEYVCQKLGVPVDNAQVEEATQIRFELTRRLMRPRRDAVETLSRLKAEGYKTGLITDCSVEVPALWGSTSFALLFDVAIFSCKVGMKKPDPRIYRLAAERLAVKPERCLYIGDGSSHELTGASKVGMHPALIRFPGEDSVDVHRVEAETQGWNGLAISSLREVPDLLE